MSKKVFKVFYTKPYGHVDPITHKYVVDGYKNANSLVPARNSEDAEIELKRTEQVQKITKIEECSDNVLGALCPVLLDLKAKFK